MKKREKREKIIFAIVHCKNRKVLRITGSAREARDYIQVGTRVDVFKNGELFEKFYARTKGKFIPYVQREKEFIRGKQRLAEMRNKAG